MEIAAHKGSTLAEALRRSVEGLSWEQARELCRRGKVSIGGAPATDPALRLRGDEQIVFRADAPRRRAHSLDPNAVVYVDRHVVVVRKPAGLLTLPFEQSDRDTLVDQVRVLLRRRDGALGNELGVVQRLDKETTGLVVFARSFAAKRELQQQFRVHSIERRYRALVHGTLTGTRTFETDLIRDRGDGLRGSFGHFRKPRNPLPKDAQHAVTVVTSLECLGAASLVECQLHTGRQHQIRIHLSEFGHPLVGEEVYIRDYPGPRLSAPRIMLHAAVLGFVHPANGQPLRFEDPPPPDFAQVLEGLRR